MASRNADVRRALAGLLDMEPKKLDFRFVIVNPSGQGSWVAGTDLSGLRVYGSTADTPTDALRNLFDKLTANKGYREDSDIQVALEMMLAGKDIAEDLFGDAPKAIPAGDSDTSVDELFGNTGDDDDDSDGGAN